MDTKRKLQEGKSSSKGNTVQLFNRYVWLVDLIYRSGRISFEEINSRWTRSSLNEDGEDLPLKTFHNHRKAIEEMFQINIECDRRAGYLYYIENADDIDQGGVRQWLMNTFAVNNLINESHRLKHRILFEKIPSGQQFLTSIIEAMRDSLIIEITYQSFWSEAPNTFEVEPLCVKVFKQRWYMVGRSTFDGKIRIYALDRIQNLLTTENSFKMPKDFDPQEYFINSYGIIVDDDYDVETIQIKVWGKQRNFLRTLPLHHSQREVKTTADYSIFEFYLRPTVDFIQEILAQSYPSEQESIQILAPGWLAEEVFLAGKAIVDANLASKSKNEVSGSL